MNKADKFKLLYIFGISLFFFFTGCVDTSVQNIPTSFDFHSQVKIVNLSSNGGAATINVTDASGKPVASATGLGVGDEYPGSGQAFLDIPSGSKTFAVTYANGSSDTFKQVMDTELRMRFFIVDQDSVTRNIIKAVERYTWQDKSSANGKKLFPPDTASVMFFNGSPDVSIAKITVTSPTGTSEVDLGGATIALGKAQPYVQYKAGVNYTFTFWSDSDSLTTINLTPQALSRYTTVIYGKSGAIQGKVYTDD